MFTFKLFREVSKESRIKIFATQVCIPRGRFDFKDTPFNVQYRNVKCTTAKVKNEYVHILIFVLIKTVRDSRRRRFINNTKTVQASDSCRIFRRLSLRIVKVGRDRYDRVRDFLTEIRFRDIFHFSKNHR